MNALFSVRVAAIATLFFFCLLRPCYGMSAAEAQSQTNCWKQAGDTYGIDPWWLYSIGKKESKLNPRAINRNNDGTIDIGIMMINSSHIPFLRKHGVKFEDLYDVCLNIFWGAYFLYDNLNHRGKGLHDATGAYNAGYANSPKQQAKRDSYANSVRRIYDDSLRYGR